MVSPLTPALFTASAGLVAAATLTKQAADEFKTLPAVDELFAPKVISGLRETWAQRHDRNFKRFLVFSLLATVVTGIASVGLKIGPEKASVSSIAGSGFSLLVSGFALLKGYRAHSAARTSKLVLEQDIRAAQERSRLRAEARAVITALKEEEAKTEPPVVHFV